MNKQTTAKEMSHTGGVTTIKTYAPTQREWEGLNQADEVLNFIGTLDSEAYGWNCLQDQVLDQYFDILSDCKLLNVEHIEQSYEDFQMLWKGTKEVEVKEEEDLTPFPFDKM